MKTCVRAGVTGLFLLLGACEASSLEPDDLVDDEPLDAFAVALSADDRLDVSFGGDGRATVATNQPIEVVDMDALLDQRIVYSANHRWGGGTFNGMPLYTRSSWTVGRRKADGSADPTWNGGVPRSLHQDLGASDSRPGDVMPVAEGRTLAVGTVTKNGRTVGVVARLEANGAPDWTFGNDGFHTFLPPGFSSVSLSWIEPGGYLRGGGSGYFVGGVAWKYGQPYEDGAIPHILIGAIDENGLVVDSFDIANGWMAKAIAPDFGHLTFGIGQGRLQPRQFWVAAHGSGRVYKFISRGDTAHAGQTREIAVPQFSSWKPRIEDMIVVHDVPVLALSPHMGIMTIDSRGSLDSLDIRLEVGSVGAFPVADLARADARRITYSPNLNRYFLVGDGETTSGARRTSTMMFDYKRDLDESFHADGRVVTDFTELRTESVTAVSSYGAKLLVAVTGSGGVSMGRYNIGWGAVGQPCYDATPGNLANDSICSGDNECSAVVCVAP